MAGGGPGGAVSWADGGGGVAGAAAAFAFAGPQWPVPLIAVVAFALGATAIGWNGIQLAEIARIAPLGKAGAVTGATGFITFFGVVVGPSLFGAIAASAAGYRGAFLLLAALACAGALLARGSGRSVQDAALRDSAR